MARIAVFGAGHLGVTHAACMAELGHDVMVVDVDLPRLTRLQAGETPFYEPGLAELLRRHVQRGAVLFTSSYDEATTFARVHFITVGTPQKAGELGADLTALHTVVDHLAPRLTKPAVVFGKSTVPVGTARQVSARLRQLAPAGYAVNLGWNPDFLRKGHAVQDALAPDRIVLGVETDRLNYAERVLRGVYATFVDAGVPLLVTDLTTAEMVKATANSFVAAKISFINAVSEMCDAVGADVCFVADAVGRDPRIGRDLLDAGVGFGGALPKDVRAVMARAGEAGADQMLMLMREVDSINVRRRSRMVGLARDMLGGGLAGARVAVLGASFTPDSDDVGDSPALNIAGQLHAEGASICVFDPHAMDNARAVFPNFDYAPDAVEACRDADVVLVLTEWQQFRELRPADLEPVVHKRRIIDGRNCLDPQRWRGAGWQYRGMGRGVTYPEGGHPVQTQSISSSKVWSEIVMQRLRSWGDVADTG
ncbi:UDP-glucose dehydrogenase family protein [Mycobacterium sp. 4D054]|uniref:UDP-glucose dehydrogenase family protein n=1 Tax=Mycobacterium sp. 4D054 TaxID=3457440 RepID=UPI003FD46E15